MASTDAGIIEELKGSPAQRSQQEKILYDQYAYLIREGCRKYNLSQEDSFSAYSDSFLSVVVNIVAGRFDGRSSIKTYFVQIFFNKCIDLIRRSATNKQQINKTVEMPDLMSQMPDAARDAVAKMIESQQMRAMKESLEKIGSRCKEVLLLFEDGYSDKDIATRLQYNNALVVKTTRLRCLDKLRERVSGNVYSR